MFLHASLSLKGSKGVLVMIHKKHFLLLVALATVLLLISACSPIGGGSGGSNLTVLQLLQNGATTTPTTSHLEQIVQGDKVYIKNTKGQWYVLDKSALKGYVDNPFSGVKSPDLTELIGLLEHTQITDNGIQSLNGQNLRHITIAMDKEALKQFLGNNQQLIDILGQQNLNAAIDNTKTFSSTVDLWIDEATAYVHRTELKFNLGVDTGTLSQSITPTVTTVIVPANVTTKFDSIVDLSKFNESVTVTTPTGAIPTNDPTTVFG